VRGGTFTVYCHPEGIEESAEQPKIAGVTGVILAGGESKRMGSNKALLEVAGSPIIARTYRILSALFHEVIVVTNTPEIYAFLPCRKVPDIFPGCGSVAGLHSGLFHSHSAHSFVTACDMPFLDPAIVRSLCDIHSSGYDALIPFSEGGQEPLHAVYSSACKDVFEKAIQAGERKILDILGSMNTRLMPFEEVQRVGGRTSSFLNVNTPEEYERIRTVRE
jgi:FdhD protein